MQSRRRPGLRAPGGAPTSATNAVDGAALDEVGGAQQLAAGAGRPSALLARAARRAARGRARAARRGCASALRPERAGSRLRSSVSGGPDGLGGLGRERPRARTARRRRARGRARARARRRRPCHRARRGGLVVEPRAVADRQQVAILHQRLDDLLVAPERLGGELGLARPGAQTAARPSKGTSRQRRDVRQRRARVVGDGVELDHSASPMRGSSCFSSRRRDRADQRAQLDVDEVDVGDRERDVAGDHDAAAEQPVDEVDQGDVALGDRSLMRAPRRRRRDEVVRRPGPGQLDARPEPAVALLELGDQRAQAVHPLRLDEVGAVEEHLALVAGELAVLRRRVPRRRPPSPGAGRAPPPRAPRPARRPPRATWRSRRRRSM